jgi:ribosomal protein S18 acetylase RimI-like enzyme
MPGSSQPRQVLMKIDLFPSAPPPAAPPAGYVLEHYTGLLSAAAWVALVNDCFCDLGKRWTEDMFRTSYASQPQFEADGFFLLRFNGDPAGTCFAWRDGHGRARVHWLCVDAAHRRQGLARHLLECVLGHFVARGERAVHLVAESTRLAAIKLYLQRGMPRRW